MNHPTEHDGSDPRKEDQALRFDATETVVPADYPELARLAWNRNASQPIAAKDALALYERNWRHVDQGAMPPAERDLVRALVEQHGHGYMLATR